MSKHLRTPEAAAYLGMTISTLEKWRIFNRGPIFSRVPGGRAVIYAVADLDAFIQSGKQHDRVWCEPFIVHQHGHIAPWFEFCL